MTDVLTTCAIVIVRVKESSMTATQVVTTSVTVNSILFRTTITATILLHLLSIDNHEEKDNDSSSILNTMQAMIDRCLRPFRAQTNGRNVMINEHYDFY